VLLVLIAATAIAQTGDGEKLVSDAMLDFNAGRYTAVKDKLLVAAQAGHTQAQIRLAEMYENGLGVTRDFVSSHAWYNIASASGNTLARTRRDALETRMTPQQRSDAQAEARQLEARVAANQTTPGGTDGGEFITLAYTFGGFADNSSTQLTVRAYRPNATALQMVQDILSFNSIPTRSFRVIESPNTANAEAGMKESGPGSLERVILYNPQFMEGVTRSTKTPWGAYSIMAHEIGHHLAGHTLQPGGSRPPLELEADYFSGGTLARMRATLDEAVAAMKQLGSPTGSATHPARNDRIAAITKGWNDARAKLGGEEVVKDPQPAPTRPEPAPAPRPAPSPVRVASECATSVGVCPLVTPLYRGIPCACFGPFGMIPGVSR